MIEEQFVSFETAKLLKEAGFDVPTSTHYSNSGEVWQSSAPEDYNDDKSCKACSRPTQALAAKWLCEVYGLHVMITPYYDCSVDADGEIVDKRMYWGYMILYAATGNLAEDNDERFDNYEQALEAGLRKVIKLIKK